MHPINSWRRVLYFQTLVEEDAKNNLGWKATLEHLAPALRKTFNPIDLFFHNLAKESFSRLGQRHRINFDEHWKDLSLPLPLTLCLFFILFLMGSFSNYFGSKHTVNLWLNPFTGFLVWNFFVYLIIALRKVVHPKNIPISSGLFPFFTTRFFQFFQGLRNKYALGLNEKTDSLAILSKIQVVFRKNWVNTFPDLLLHKMTATLHFSAIIFSLGVITGLYFRGFAETYQFTWESTFISPQSRPFWLNLIFGPVLILAKPLFPNGLPDLDHANGAPWIHLFAIATFFYIVIPRAALAFLAYRRHKKAPTLIAFNWSETFWQSWYAASSPDKIPLHFIFYSFEPPAKQKDALASKLQKSLPGKYSKGWEKKLPWGETELPQFDTNTGGFLVVLFNAAQTPEDEVHGAFAENLWHYLHAAPSPFSLLVLLNTSSLSLESYSQRIALWRELLRRHEISSVYPVPLTEPFSENISPAIQDAIMRFQP